MNKVVKPKKCARPGGRAPPPPSRTTWPPSTTWPASGKPVIGARLAKHMASPRPAVTEAIQRMTPRRLREGRAGQGADAHHQGPPDRRGHGAPPPAARALAHRHARASTGPTPTRRRTGSSTRSRRAWRTGWPRCSACRARARTATRSPAWPSRRASSRSRSPRRRKARPSSSSASPRRPRPTRSCSSTSGGTTCVPDGGCKIIEVAPWAGTITASGDGRPSRSGLPAAAKIWVYLPGRPTMRAMKAPLLGSRRDRRASTCSTRARRPCGPTSRSRGVVEEASRSGASSGGAERAARVKERDRQEGGRERDQRSMSATSPCPTRGGRSTSACAGRSPVIVYQEPGSPRDPARRTSATLRPSPSAR